MGIRRLIWGLLIAAAALLYLFDNETITLAVLAVCIAAPVGSGLLLLLYPSKVTLELISEDGRFVRSGSDPAPKVILQVFHPGPFPISGLCFLARFENLRTGEITERPLQITAPGRRPIRIPLPGQLVHAGRYEISVRIEEMTDPMRLFVRKAGAQTQLQLSVFPEEAPIGLSLLGSAPAMLDSDRYSEKRRGNDPGEVRSIYEYQPGDPVRNIHWKLSEKVDKLLVKELGMPVADPMLVLLGSCGQTGGEEAAQASDTVLAVFASLLSAALEAELDCCAGWQNREGVFQTRRITGPEDLTVCASDYLEAPAEWRGTIASFWEDPGRERFSHLIVVGEDHPADLDRIAGGCQITLLQYGHSASMRDDGGVSVIGFEKDDWKQVLTEIEV